MSELRSEVGIHVIKASAWGGEGTSGRGISTHRIPSVGRHIGRHKEQPSLLKPSRTFHFPQTVDLLTY